MIWSRCTFSCSRLKPDQYFSVKITIVGSDTLEGSLFAACPITNLVAIGIAGPTTESLSSSDSATPSSYHVIPISRIQTFQLVSRPDGPSATFSDAQPPIGRVDLQALEAREAAAIAKLKERAAARGRGVGREAQEIFDALART